MILLITYILNIIDYLFTLYWVRKYGIEIEGNPFGRWLFDNNIAWVVKIFAVGGLLALLGYISNDIRSSLPWLIFRLPCMR